MPVKIAFFIKFLNMKSNGHISTLIGLLHCISNVDYSFILSDFTFFGLFQQVISVIFSVSSSVALLLLRKH